MGKILVTGGAGYIASHTVVELLAAGYDVVAIDNLANSSRESLRRVEKISGKKVRFHKADCTDRPTLSRIFSQHDIAAVIHFAGLKAVGESVREPLLYYRNNIGSTVALCETMQEAGVHQLVFSSSATVYAPDNPLPWSEDSRTGGDIPHAYGKSKYMVEQILADLAASNDAWQITTLRYFNPIGAHPSGLIGEDPDGLPNNLLPFVSQVAVGKRDRLHIFGDDYPTVDGTCIRDFIHVCDLARGHVAALAHPAESGRPAIYNLGSGKGSSVMEVVRAFETACGHPIPYVIDPRRPGDLPEYYADPTKAGRELSWQAEKTLQDACQDTWNWQSHNPDGYRTVDTPS